jgi:predicted outer membrane repeat protein
MNRSIKFALSASILATVAGTAFGQADRYNVDLNRTSGTGAGVPASTYGGAARQPGVWNSITSASATTTQLKNLDGSNSFVTFTRDTIQPFSGADDAGYTSDAGLLMEDYQGASGAAQMQYTFNDMPAGTYAVYVYSKRPASTQTCTVTVTGSTSAAQSVGGTTASASNDMIPGVACSIHIVDLNANGPIQIKVTNDAGGWATCAGIQVVKLSKVFNGLKFYVDPNTRSGAVQDGMTWGTAFHDLNPILKQAALIGGFDVEIWAANAIYKPTTGTSRTETFTIPNGIEFHGGFAGGETSMSERIWQLNPTYLLGSIGTAADTDNSYHVVTINNTSSATSLSGWFIGRGYASGSGNDGKGGGLYITNSSVDIRDSRVLLNSAGSDGGGMYISGANATFNEAPLLSNVYFGSNDTNSTGGAIFAINASNLHIANCDFRGNYAAGQGGAIKITTTTGATIANSLFTGNTASFDNGGAIYATGTDAQDITLVNCTVVGNSSGQVCGGLYMNNGADATLNNCIFWSNTDQFSPTLPAKQFGGNGGVGSTVTTSFTTVEGISANPIFIDADGPDNIFGTVDDNCRVAAWSPVIDAGSTSLMISDSTDVDGDGNKFEKTPLDLDGKPRQADITTVADTGVGTPPIDRGCYESQPPCPADLNQDGFVNGDDYDAFASRFEAGC